MIGTVLQEIFIPFVGTALGAACVLFVKEKLNRQVERAFTGFAAGVMVAASVWGLLIPSMEQSEQMGRLAFVPAVVGLAVGFLFLQLLDRIIPHLHMHSQECEGPNCNLKRSSMMMLAVALHNLPEGMAVGVVFAALLNGSGSISTASAFALALGIAIQNFPEGAVISLPLRSDGMRRNKAFGYGFASGIVEPIGALLTFLLASSVTAALPFILSFAAGAMIYVVVEELIPEAQREPHSNVGTIGAALGFALMMVLDVALG